MTRRDLISSSTMTQPQRKPAPAVTSALAAASPSDAAAMLSTIHDFLAELGKKPAPLTFAVAVSADMAQGHCSFTRIENGEMKVLWAGRLSEIGDWPAGAKLWLHRDDYDRLCREVPAR